MGKLARSTAAEITMSVYRAFLVGEAGHVFAPPQAFEAKSDVEAVTKAMQFVDGHTIEVWDTVRRVAVIQRRYDEH